MTNEANTYRWPNVGCMIGKAYNVLTSQLEVALTDAGLNITVAEYLILRCLYTRDGIQQCEIATTVGKDKASVCRCISKMAQKDLVKTEPVSHKCLKVFLTEYARSIEAQIEGIADSRPQTLASLLTENEMASFSDMLNRIINQQKTERIKL